MIIMTNGAKIWYIKRVATDSRTTYSIS